MIRILKLSLTILITAGLLSIASWFFLRNSILEKFNEESMKIKQQISILTEPESGKESMEKYLASSGKLIINHLSVPFFPLVKEMKKNEMKQTVSERMGDFRIKLEQMNMTDPEVRVVTYHSVVSLFNELFPDKSSAVEETLKITIRAGVENYGSGEDKILERARSISGSSKTPVPPDTSKNEKQPGVMIKTENKKENTSVIQKNKNKADEDVRIIPLSRAGEHIGTRVYVYLETGRKLEGFIKMLGEIYLHLDIEFKGGIFTAKILKRDIDEIIKVKESSIFKYLREQSNGS